MGPGGGGVGAGDGGVGAGEGGVRAGGGGVRAGGRSAARPVVRLLVVGMASLNREKVFTV